jgi:hypothetical protein
VEERLAAVYDPSDNVKNDHPLLLTNPARSATTVSGTVRVMRSRSPSGSSDSSSLVPASDFGPSSSRRPTRALTA